MTDPLGKADAPLPSVAGTALDVLAEVAAYLATGIDTDEAKAAVAGALKRGLKLARCRLWVRSPDGVTFRSISAPGELLPSDQEAEDNIRWLDAGEPAGGAPDAIRVRLSYEGATLGLLEAIPSGQTTVAVVQRVGEVLGNTLSPLLASAELSQDLAGEVALRTREIDAQRRFTAQIIDSLPLGLYVIDRQFRIQAWNRKRETGTQGVVRDEVLGRTVFDVLYRQPRELLRREFDRVFETGKMEQLEVDSIATGETRYYRLTKIPMRLDGDEVSHVITIGEDVTEWKSVQQQIAQTDKLAAVGQLAAGVMHEINNPLATITACLEALASRSHELGGARQSFEEYYRIMESELTRCKRIVDGLLDFSRPKARYKKVVPINPIVEDSLFLVKHHDRFKRIKLVRRLADGLLPVEANAEQLIQAFLAIMLNAIDAMEGDGILTVATGSSPDRADEVFVEFSDTGPGIPREQLPKIFEPFFSTKTPGRGTGLGLSICYGIVAEHRGHVQVDSQPGQGTTFRVLLPGAGKGGDGA
ncbi:MAG TPA: ATP-binding protein [Gemmatimonadales bacterium]|jgi:two-component system NtrC family sensor kinase|nr:ATP-binding protein [Gemmatimonadales bacterium]